jgi:putative DNA primase/helicase
VERPRLEDALAQLSAAVEGALRLLEAHEAQREKAAKPEAGSALTFDPIEPWPEAVDGGQLLTALTELFEAYLVLPPGAAKALALWTVHAYTYDTSDITPRLGAVSATMRSGKTRVLETLSLLVPRMLLSSNSSPAAIFRAIELWNPTLLIDEADTTLPGNEELRGILNSGHTRRTAFVLRTVGDEHMPRKFSTWTPLAIAMIGDLPGTLADRSIVIPMQRKKRSEKVARLPLDDAAQPFADLRRRCARWAADSADTLRTHQPSVPEGLNDRAADNWRPLCAIAEVAGGDWPAQVHQAIAALVGITPEEDEASVLLLRDMQAIFTRQQVDYLFSEDLATALHTMEGRPWPEYGRERKPISVHQIARLLKPFGIRPKTLRKGTERAKGYQLDDCKDIFLRYTPPSEP